MLAISTDDLSKAKLFAGRMGLPFPVLYDPSAEVVRAYDVFNLLGDLLATPSTFIIDRDGVVRWKYVGRDIDDRASVAQVLKQLRLLEG